MAMPSVGLSGSSSSAANSSGQFGDVNITSGGRQTTMFYIVAGILGLVALLFFFKRKS